MTNDESLGDYALSLSDQCHALLMWLSRGFIRSISAVLANSVSYRGREHPRFYARPTPMGVLRSLLQVGCPVTVLVLTAEYPLLPVERGPPKIRMIRPSVCSTEAGYVVPNLRRCFTRRNVRPFRACGGHIGSGSKRRQTTRHGVSLQQLRAY